MLFLKSHFRLRPAVALWVLLLGAAAPGCAPGYTVVQPSRSAKVVVVAPPPLHREYRPHRPHRRAVWVPGYWAWRGHRYVWREGYWARPPRRHAVWVAPVWRPVRGGWVFVAGFWR